MGDTANRVIKCIADMAGTDAAAIKPETKLVEWPLDMDSLDVIEAVMAIEEEFEIVIEDEEAEKCTTVADVVALVEGKVRVAA